MQYYGNSAVFISAGGYHHHIGLNTWYSKNGSPPPPNSTGLFHTAILYPTRKDLAIANFIANLTWFLNIYFELVAKVFIIVFNNSSITRCPLITNKSYFEISKIAKNPWKAYVRDIKNQFRYNPALFTITIMGFILACSSIIQVLQTANIIKPIS